MRARGFTLIEVVLAMTLLGLIAGVVYGIFYFGVTVGERGEVAVASAQRLRLASDILIRQIKSVVAYPARNGDDEVYPYFYGSSKSMAFVTATAQSGGGGLGRVVYRVEEGPRLVLEESTEFTPDGLGQESLPQHVGQEAVLLEDFDDLRFEYLLDDGVDFEWRDSWDGYVEEMLPAAVRVTVEGIRGLGGAWTQEIPLMTTAYGDNDGEVGEEDLLTTPEAALGEEEE